MIDDRGNELLVVKSLDEARMSAFEVEQPILNSPFEEPAEHWQIEEGQAPKRATGRRRAGYFYRDPKAPPPEAGQPARGEWQELELVNLIRERLAQWREAGYPGATRTTLDLIQSLAARGARAAALLRPARGGRDDHLPERGARRPPPGRRRAARGRARRASRRSRRYACKMATGSGKTTVMGMLAAWSILNKVAARGDARFSDVVLVVCPNVTIRERLRELDPNRGEASIYRTRDLVPPHLMPTSAAGACSSRTGTSSSARG